MYSGSRLGLGLVHIDRRYGKKKKMCMVSISFQGFFCSV